MPNDDKGRFAVVVAVCLIELVLLVKLFLADTSNAVGLLAAIVIIACLLVLSLTFFKGSLEQDLRELEKNVGDLKDKDVYTLNRDVEELKKDLKKLEGQIEKK